MDWFSNNGNIKRINRLEGENERLKEEINALKSELESIKSQQFNKQISIESFAQIEQLITFENEQMNIGMSDIQENLAKSVEAAKETLSNVAELKSNFQLRADNLNLICNEINQLSKTSEQTDSEVNNMSTRAEEISSILQLIQGIAEQTNLLALNASIEAARTGETGRGFAVVADEVRGLADKTQGAIIEINSVISSLKKNVSSVSMMSSQLIGNIGSVVDKMASFEEIMKNSDRQVTSHFNTIGTITDRVFMCLAKTDHIIWKLNTYLSINNKKASFEFVDHHNCRLGKWYYQGEGKTFFSQSSHYSALEKPHSQVHSCTKDIFSLIANEDIDYSNILKAAKNMEEASQQVFDGLSKIANDSERSCA